MNQARVLLQSCLQAIKPPLKVTVSQWADNYRFLSQESSSEPGKFSTKRTPYIVEIMDALSDKAIKKVVFMASSQVGKTEFLLNVIGYYIDYDPCPMLLVQPTDEMAQAFSKERLAPMLRDTPRLRNRIRQAKVKKKDQKAETETILTKKFKGGTISMVGSNSPAKLASRPIRIILIDECDRFNITGVGGEGDSIKLAEKRTKTFWNKKILIVSTPGIEGQSQIAREYEASDKRQFHIPCPHCKEKFVFVWENMKWENSDYTTAAYYCQECGEEFPEETKLKALEEGVWIAQEPTRDIAGFHLNEMYSPWVKFQDIVKEFLEAKKGGPATLQTWVNTSLGKTWKQANGDAPAWKEIYARRKDYKIGSIPEGVKIITGGIDVQKNRIEYEIVGYGYNYESWSIDYSVVFLDTSDETELVREVEKILYTEYDFDENQTINIARLAIDSGYNTQSVYNCVRSIGSPKLIPIKGSDSQSTSISLPKAVEVSIGRNRKMKGGVNLFTVGSTLLKNQLYGFLKRLPLTEKEAASGKDSPKGICHFPQYDDEFFKMLTAETYTFKIIKGYRKYFFEKNRDRNEALDCRVYSNACLELLGYMRWSNEKLDKIAKKFLSPRIKLPKVIKKKKKKNNILDGY